MRRSFQDADFSDLAELWNRFYPARYGIDADLLRLNTVESPVFDWGASQIEYEGGRPVAFVSIKRSASPKLYPGGDPDREHLSAVAFEDPFHAVDLLAEAKRMLRNRGCSTLVYGSDSAHFFPGLPEDFPTLAGFLMVEGFEGDGLCHDLERDLTDYVAPYDKVPGAEVRPFQAGEESLLEGFLAEEFPGRWRWDTMAKLAAEGASQAAVGIWHSGSLKGFALIQTSESRRPIGGAVWRKDLGENWGALGPIGVAKANRGEHLGHALLGGALEILRDRGAKRTIIDWTGLVDFYGRHGFEVTRTYRSQGLLL